MKRRFQPVFIRWRFYFINILVLFVVACLIARMIDLTVIKRSFLRHQGDMRAVRVVTTPGFRGIITDRNGYPLAVSTAVYSIWVNPQDFLVTPENIQIIAKLLKLKSKDIQALVEKNKAKHHQFVYLKRDVAPQIATSVKKLALPGVFLQEEFKRYYPEGEVAAHVIGFTNIDDKGQEGLELAYNPVLAGREGKTVVVQDRRGHAVTNLQTLQEQRAGGDIKLSIDRRIQYLAYRELLAGLQTNVAKAGTVVVLDTKTGEILAMVNLPSFNPNNRVGAAVDAFRNRAVTDTFEPGSTIKAFSVTSALTSGKFNPNSVIDTHPGWMRVDRHVVRDEHNNGLLTVGQILQYSSNVGVTKMILSLPPEQLWKVLHNVGFGESTGVGFPGEQAGSLVQRKTWQPFALATLAFGYGVSVTPLQLVQAYAIFANDGRRIPVSLLKLDKPPTSEQVINPEIAQQMMLLLETVTTAKRGTGELARVPGYRIAGKTGTALMAGPHGYQKDRRITTFIGIAPVSHPRVVIAVIIHEPHGKFHHASFVAAPVFKKIMEGTLRILNVAPDDVESLEKKAV